MVGFEGLQKVATTETVDDWTSFGHFRVSYSYELSEPSIHFGLDNPVATSGAAKVDLLTSNILKKIHTIEIRKDAEGLGHVDRSRLDPALSPFGRVREEGDLAVINVDLSKCGSDMALVVINGLTYEEVTCRGFSHRPVKVGDAYFSMFAESVAENASIAYNRRDGAQSITVSVKPVSS